MAAVSVGAATRAAREVGQFGYSVQNPGSSAAVGSATRAARLGVGAATGEAAPAWTPPPIPAGAYNPIRDIELNAGKRGTQNTVEDLGTKESRGQASYLLGVEGVKRQEAEQAQGRSEALASLQRSYQRLGVRQTEQAREAGVLRGGAVLQSAAKRTANEGIAKAPIETSFQRQQEGDQRSLGQLALSRQQEAEDDTTGIGRAEREQSQFGVDTQTLEGREAAENGYVAPSGPAKLVYNKINPANGQSYREFKNAKGQTVHEYNGGRRVTL